MIHPKCFFDLVTTFYSRPRIRETGSMCQRAIRRPLKTSMPNTQLLHNTLARRTRGAIRSIKHWVPLDAARMALQNAGRRWMPPLQKKNVMFL